MIAVCGFGNWGKNIVRELSKTQHLTCVVEPDKQRWPPEETRTCLWVESMEDMPPVDAVVIATPINTHYVMAMKCIERKQHVFVEKPLAGSPLEGKTLVDAAQKNGVRIFVGHILHYHSSFIQLFQWLKNHPEEPVIACNIVRGVFPGMRATGPVLWDLAPHDLSIVLRLAKGSEIQHMHATQIVGKQVQAHIEFESMACHFTWTQLQLQKQATYTLMTPNYIIELNDTKADVKQKLVFRCRFTQHPGLAGTTPLGINTDATSPLEKELDTFIQYIQGKTKAVHTDGHEGVQVVKLLAVLQGLIA